MTSVLAWQAILSGITNGFVYALIGIGLAVIFKGTRIINAMQGEFAMIGGIVAVFAFQHNGVPYVVAAFMGVLAGAGSGWLIDVLFVRAMMARKAGEESFLLLTIGLAFTASAAVLYFVGRDSYLLPSIGGAGVVEILGAFMPVHALWLIMIAIVVVILLRRFYTRSVVGLSMAAASINPDGAATNGINVALMRSYTFMLGGAVGALAGILVTPLISMNYHMGITLTLKGFAAAILGGLANPLGAVFGGLVIGMTEALAVVGLSSGYKDVAAMTLMIIMMIFMPNGLLGGSGRRGG
ncbi:branched-chain amino acid ABC transporter permease [Ensifer adhaerens]|uniref:branched-chain amino acid ABC transporter permease n=1 Tax=Ensifer adhaerens TaxID=106592 RepID=UPI000FD84D1D|nr:branched-chain amino acid ABC transporter permease [Ensifer adhaerens]MDF8357666.1 branched-chain amino acid ABC transporter permease [Ensifer adhaerens]THA60238.1 branched-chain amino acid ABC transporter permease [Ensifer adhaerens]